MSLYSINSDYLDLLASIEDAEGEVTPEQETALAINESELLAKSDGYAYVIATITGQIATIDAEVTRLKDLKKARQRGIERLKGALLGAVTLHGKYESDTHKFSTRKSTSVIIDDIEQVPAEYLVAKVTTSPDKNAIKAAGDVPGTHLQHNESLVIK